MIGKVILGVLLGLLLLLLAALLVPARLRFSYEGGEPLLTARYGPVRLQLFPPKKKKEPPGASEPAKEEEAPPPEDGGAGPEKKGKKKRGGRDKKKEPKEKKKFRINLEQILYSLEVLPPILGRALRRTGGSLRIAPLKLYVLAAGEDPADTALLYGRLSAAAAAALPALERAAKDPDIQLYLDFTEKRMDFAADVGVAVRPIRLAWIALRAGGSLLKWFIGFRRLASPPPEEKTREHEAA